MYSQRSKLILSLARQNNEDIHSETKINTECLPDFVPQNNEINNVDTCLSDLILSNNLQGNMLLINDISVRDNNTVIENISEFHDINISSSPYSIHFNEAMEPAGGTVNILFDSDDLVADKDYVPENLSDCFDSDDSIPLAKLKYKNKSRNSEQTQIKKNINLGNVEGNTESEQAQTNETGKRKRQKHALSMDERKTLKLRKKIEYHQVKENCKENCRRKCLGKISENRKIQINEQFWQMNDSERKTFIMHKISSIPVKRRTSGENSRRNQSLQYFLENEEGEKHYVCKKFFLATLGFELKNDRILRNLVTDKNAGKIAPKSNERGRKEAHNKFNLDIIIGHIESFNPSISHYRREHAPRRLYLPSDITIVSMYQKFCTDYPQYNVSYELYRREVAKKNISFIKLGHEECFACETFFLHQKSSDHKNLIEPDTCDDCKTYNIHKAKYNLARIEYKSDSDPQNQDISFSADLQKVIMLPRCDMYKEIIFVPRIVAFNESFVPVGKNKKTHPVACIWHEGITGRKKEDIISTFYAFFLEMRDFKKIILWLDNCSGQNKNWALFCFLIYVVNCNMTNLHDLEIKYFEPGHTFMSADTFHHAVEGQLKRKGKVYDFQDFKECVQNASSKAKVIDMSLENFYNWPDHTSLTKINNSNPRPYMSDIVHLKLTRGNKTIQYRNSFTSDFITMNFLKAKQMKTDLIVNPKRHCRGEYPKGESILFWQNCFQFYLHTDDSSGNIFQ